MATRAVYSFIDENNIFHVYKHHDNYPESATDFINDTLFYSWPLPRFEADEFACGFICTNKHNAGGMYLTKHWDCHGDLDYRYEISLYNHQLHIQAFEMPKNEMIFKGSLQEMLDKYSN